MITIIIPAWLVWTLIGLVVIQTMLNSFLAYLTRRNGKVSRDLIVKLTELAGIRGGGK